MPLRQGWGSRMAKLKLSPLAEEDLRQIRAYIEQESEDSDLATKQLIGIIQKLPLLQEQPQMGVLNCDDRHDDRIPISGLWQTLCFL